MKLLLFSSNPPFKTYLFWHLWQMKCRNWGQMKALNMQLLYVYLYPCYIMYTGTFMLPGPHRCRHDMGFCDSHGPGDVSAMKSQCFLQPKWWNWSRHTLDRQLSVFKYFWKLTVEAKKPNPRAKQEFSRGGGKLLLLPSTQIKCFIIFFN